MLRASVFLCCAPVLAVGWLSSALVAASPQHMESKSLLTRGATEWVSAESTVAFSTERVKAAPRALHWQVLVDHTAGEPNYPVGWPRISLAIPEGPERDWSSWDFLHMRIYVDTSRDSLPREPASLILRVPDKASSYVRSLSELKKGQWVDITVPIAQIPRHENVTALQFSVSEANYRHGDRVDFFIEDLSLLRYAQPVLLDFAPERNVMFAGEAHVPVRFRVAGAKPGESLMVTCELRRGNQRVARASWRVSLGPQRQVLTVVGKRLEPGVYSLTARIAESATLATARVRLVESPWQ